MLISHLASVFSHGNIHTQLGGADAAIKKSQIFRG